MQGHDKGLIRARGKRLVEYALEKLAFQVESVFISANRNIETYETLGFRVIADCYGEFAGPLAGILTALEYIPEDSLLLVVPCDMPDLPKDLATRMTFQLQQANADLCCVQNRDRLQPLVIIMHSRVRGQLRRFLESGQHKVHDWLDQSDLTTVDYRGHEKQFININTHDELLQYEQQQA